MKYEVIHAFTDLLDNRYAYAVGDSFPREGIDVSEERLKELSGSNNKQGVPLIKKIKAKPKNTSKKKKVEDKIKEKVEESADRIMQGTE